MATLIRITMVVVVVVTIATVSRTLVITFHKDTQSNSSKNTNIKINTGSTKCRSNNNQKYNGK